MPSPIRLVSTAPTALARVERIFSGNLSPWLLATGLTALVWLLVSTSGWSRWIPFLFLANLVVLWIAAAPLRKARQALAELSNRTAALDKTVLDRALELERTKRELASVQANFDAFSHSVSHELRAPLRGVLNYTRTVLEDDENNLSDESKAYLGYSIQAAHRSNELIELFLDLARSSTKPLDRTNFDLAAMASAAIETLRTQDPSRDVEFVGPASAKAFGDRGLLRKAVQNLLSNAWKFTSKTPNARIEFAIETESDGAVFVVRDNGVGFEMAHADRLFRNFTRLHTNDDFEGTGIGLAITHRILERHGGWIRAKGEPGNGAEFRFWLPPQPESAD